MSDLHPGVSLVVSEYNPVFEPLLEKFGYRQGNVITKISAAPIPKLKMVVTLHDPQGKRIALPLEYAMNGSIDMQYLYGNMRLGLYWKTELDNPPRSERRWHGGQYGEI